MKQIILSISILCLMAVAISSCKKTENTIKAKRIAKIEKPGASYTYNYNNNNQLISKTYIDSADASNNEIERFNYNAAGLVSEYDNPSGSGLNKLEYNAQNKLVKVLNYTTANVLSKQFDITYNADNTVMTLKAYSVSGSIKQLFYTETYNYDSRGNITTVIVDYVPPTMQDYKKEYSGYDNSNYLNEIMTLGWLYPYAVNKNNPGNVKITQLSNSAVMDNLKFEYTYDTQGYITQMKSITLPSNYTRTFKITWE